MGTAPARWQRLYGAEGRWRGGGTGQGGTRLVRVPSAATKSYPLSRTTEPNTGLLGSVPAQELEMIQTIWISGVLHVVWEQIVATPGATLASQNTAMATYRIQFWHHCNL